MEEIMLRINNVSKQYVLGQIGGTTLRDELQRWSARRKGKEDPTKKIGAKDYNKGEKFLALDGISFDVKKGERVGIIGHNGAGKSTLLKLISRVTAPTSGVIGLNGRVASMLEVGTGFHPELTGRENVYMNGAILGMTKKEIDAKMEDIIEFSEVRQFIDTPVKRYSSGMYVKLAFSVAAHLDSEIMIMDEVLAVGDMAFQKKCLDKMSDVSKTEGRTILYVSHNMNTIRQLCDRVVVLDHGKVIFDGGVEEGIECYLGSYTNSPASINLENYKRTQESIHGLKITGIEIIDRDGWRINVGEKLRYLIKIHAYKAFENIGYRTRVSTPENLSVTVYLAPNLISCSEGEDLSIPLEVDTSQLVPGHYFITLALYDVDELGRWRFYDHIDRAVCLDVETSIGFNGNMPWEARWWGNVKLPDMVDLRMI